MRDPPEFVVLAIPNVLGGVMLALALGEWVRSWGVRDAALAALVAAALLLMMRGDWVRASEAAARADKKKSEANPRSDGTEINQGPPRCTVAFLGMGVMGARMAAVLSKQERVELRVWNRTAAAAHKVEKEWPRCKAFESVEDCVEGCDWVLTCLSTTADVIEVVQRVPRVRNAVIDCTSGEPELSRDLANKLAARGIVYIDAPVSGGPQGAANGTLTFMVGCDSPDLFQSAKPLLAAMGKLVVHLGPVGSGHSVKAINNAINATCLMMSMEGLAALAKKGVNINQALEAINASSGRNQYTESRIPRYIMSRKFDFGFALKLMAKDQGIAEQVLDPALKGGYINLTARLLREAVDRYGGDVDFTQCARLMEDKVGVKLESLKNNAVFL